MDFIDERRGWAIWLPPGQLLREAKSGIIAATADGGQTWTEVSEVPFQLEFIDFVDSQHGWVAGQDVLFATTDGGRTWEQQAHVVFDPRPTNLLTVDGLSFATPDIGWFSIRREGVLGTSDGGRTWSRVDLPCTAKRYLVSLVDERTGWLLCVTGTGAGWSYANLYRTADGGQTWEEVVDRPGSCGYENDLFFLDETTGWLKSSFARACVFATDDGGKTWREISRPETINYHWMTAPRFIDPQHGWIVSAGGPYPPGRVYATSDGGQTWTSLPQK